jgi:arylformamidase
MVELDLEKEYNNRRRVPDWPEIAERWQMLSSGYRLATRARLDLSYGPGPRHRYDLFPVEAADAPLAVYIHGGYWQRGERKDYSFVARELNAKGISVALPTYSLCPEVTVMDIVAELQTFLAALWAETNKHPVVVGHSAGGHLTAAMVATDWSKIPGVPADLVRAGYAISGLFDLPPLVGTTINDLVKMTAQSARTASPLFWPPPPKSRRFVAAVGEEEGSEYHRQASDIAEAWSLAGVDARCVEIVGTNHFTIVDELNTPSSVMLADIVDLARFADAARQEEAAA